MSAIWSWLAAMPLLVMVGCMVVLIALGIAIGRAWRRQNWMPLSAGARQVEREARRLIKSKMRS